MTRYGKQFSMFGWGTDQFIFSDVTTPSSLFRWETVESVGMSSVFPLVMWTKSVLSVTQLGRDHSSFINHQCHMIFESITKVRLAWLRRGMVQSCLFRCNNVVNRFSAFCYTTRLGWNSCVCVCVCVWERNSLTFVFFDVTTSSSLFKWETVQSVGMWNGSVLFFSM